MAEHDALMNALCHVTKIIPEQKHVIPVSAESAAAALNLTREFLQVSKQARETACITQ